MLIYVCILNLFKVFFLNESNENNVDIKDNDEDVNSMFYLIYIYFLFEINNSY